MVEELNIDDTENLLTHQDTGRIGCHLKDFTYLVPVGYAYDGKAVYCHSDKGMKIDVMRQNHKVCFEVDTVHNLTGWQTVIPWGNFEEIDEPIRCSKALQLSLDRELPNVVSNFFKICDDWPFHPGDFNETGGIVFRINLTSKTGKYENPENKDTIV